MISSATVRERAAALEALAEIAQAAIPADDWRAGAHGAAAGVRPSQTGEGYRLSLSRMGRSTPGPEHVAGESTTVAAALDGAGCSLERREFGGGDAVWIVAMRGDAELVVKLAANGNRLVTAQTREFADADADEAADALEG